LPADSCIMVGDRLETDVRMGLEAGMATALTLTGATDKAALTASSIQPTYILCQLGDLLPYPDEPDPTGRPGWCRLCHLYDSSGRLQARHGD
jgi:phosphoglycolate phosphatase-like HAD superfamily hydrolase